MQAKVESLASLNTFLKEQVDTKERSLREAEEKLRKKDDAIRKAYADCEQQHQKIKKRELIISRVLKRLENINAITGIGSIMDEEDGQHQHQHQPRPESPKKREYFGF